MKIRKLYIDPQVADYPEIAGISARIKAGQIVVADPDEVLRDIRSGNNPETAGKHSLFITRNKGPFIRKCPGTSHYTCCDYHILHIGAYCTMDCSYCILQAYFHPPVLTLFVNFREMTDQLETLFSSGPMYRTGTGEFTDSLIWEPVYPLASHLVNLFSGRDNAVLELKTKTVATQGLLGLDHRRNTIVSWSLNTEKAIREQERGTASLDDRIHAAAECQLRGYPLGFHFDPMIWYPGCEADYARVVRKLFRRIDPGNVVWISMGSFRFMPHLQEIIERRHPRSDIVYGEFIRGQDGKMRYFKPLRIRLYRALAEAIRNLAPDVTLYFCMEDDEVWGKVLGYTPDQSGGLPSILDASAARHCGLDPNRILEFPRNPVDTLPVPPV